MWDPLLFSFQRARPPLFTNALPATVACSARKAIEILMAEPQRVQMLRDNVAYARKGIRDAGFEVLESPTAICPIIVGDTVYFTETYCLTAIEQDN